MKTQTIYSRGTEMLKVYVYDLLEVAEENGHDIKYEDPEEFIDDNENIRISRGFRHAIENEPSGDLFEWHHVFTYDEESKDYSASQFYFTRFDD